LIQIKLSPQGTLVRAPPAAEAGTTAKAGIWLTSSFSLFIKCPKFQQVNEECAKFYEECATPLLKEKRALAGKCFESSLSGDARFGPSLTIAVPCEFGR
jgi:hypothetical protein